MVPARRVLSTVEVRFRSFLGILLFHISAALPYLSLTTPLQPLHNSRYLAFVIPCSTTARFIQDKEMLTELVMPDLSNFNLKAYVGPGAKRNVIEKSPDLSL
jgi:hypothetical protein